ncbi:MAG TPA: SurA N-terminal domain-containing protein [Anaeromyxobacter sp.]
MLDVLRSNAKSVFTWVIVGGLALIFAINFGPGSLSKGGLRAAPPPYAAKVNGKAIPVAEWARMYDRLYQSYRQQFGEAFTREVAERSGLPQQAMEMLVNQELIVQEARRRGLVVTSEELTKDIQSMPSFQENGQYKHDLYLDWARQSFGSERKFETLRKDDLLRQKMMAALHETVKIPDAEVREVWQAEADKVGLVFVRFPLAAAEAEVAKPSEAEAKAFAQKEAERVKKFYEENRARYDQKKKVRVRHVLARVAPGADDAAARKKIEEAAARVKKGEDFAKVAQALSEDENTKARGGEIGFITEGLFDPAFVNAAFALAPGAVSDPVKSASGWHLVQAEEVVPARQVSLEDARDDIARELLVKERARKLVQAKAQAALDAARKGKALAALFPQKPGKLDAQPVVAEETGPFGRGSSFVPKLGSAPEVSADAFAAKKGDVLPRVYETTAGPVVAAVTLRETPDPAAFAAQREGLEAALRNRKETQIVGAWMKEIRSSARIELNPDVAGSLAAAQTSVPD